MSVFTPSNDKTTIPSETNENDPNLIIFPWTLRWLKGNEYFHLIQNYRLYNESLGFEILFGHPNWIYHQPQNGKIYFLDLERSLIKIGFPRINAKKVFAWRKMNFRTNLPKDKPMVTYIVATARGTSQCFRMHIVAPFNFESVEKYMILCHILQVDPIDSVIDPTTGKRRKKMQIPLRQLTLMNELRTKIQEDMRKNERKVNEFTVKNNGILASNKKIKGEEREYSDIFTLNREISFPEFYDYSGEVNKDLIGTSFKCKKLILIDWVKKFVRFLLEAKRCH